ncbi:MAG TPA: putative sugar nucleotidyl transferase [Phycisphaerae bacterium]|nr:putative sugar nucleotidyl transferase [Phycisphaerae bacterium]
MQLLIFEDDGYRNLLPLVYSRATFNLRCGFDNLLAKIEAAVGLTADALFVRKGLARVIAERQTRRVNQPSTSDDQLWVNGRLLLRKGLDLTRDCVIWRGDAVAAARLSRTLACKLTPEVLLDRSRLRELLTQCQAVELSEETGMLIDYPWQIVHENAAEIIRQSRDRQFTLAGTVSPGAHLISNNPIHIGSGSVVKPGAVLDAEHGPIYVGEKVTIQPTAVIQGPCYIGDGCTIQPGASIRAGCSIGMVCKVGGEVESTIFHGYSNKQHDGFIGHSYVGEWVNLGADTVGSDLKNTYGPVRVPINGVPIDSGQAFVGAFIGDHTKTAIRTALPTGCVIGYACNLAVGGYVPQFVPSFTWLTDKGAAANDPAKALDVARKVVARRNRTYSPAEEAFFLSIPEDAHRHEAASPSGAATP